MKPHFTNAVGTTYFQKVLLYKYRRSIIYPNNVFVDQSILNWIMTPALVDGSSVSGEVEWWSGNDGAVRMWYETQGESLIMCTLPGAPGDRSHYWYPGRQALDRVH